ncbi:MAG: membrane protein insertase YidC [Bacteroidales bacterium]
MNRNTVLGLILIFGIFIGWSLLMRPSKEEQEKMQRRQDSIVRADSINAARMAAEKRIRDSLAIAEKILQQQQQPVVPEEAPVEPEKAVADDAKHGKDRREMFGIFAEAMDKDEKHIVLGNKRLELTLTTEGGKIYKVRLKDYQTYDSLPLILFDSDTSAFGLQFFAQNRTIFTDALHFEPYFNGSPFEGNALQAEDGKPVTLSMRLKPSVNDSRAGPERYIEYIYTVEPDAYMISMDIKIVGMQDVISTSGSILDLKWRTNLRKQEKSVDRFNGSTIYYKFEDGDTDYLSERSDDKESLTDKIKWASFKQHFFSSTIIAGEHFVNPVMETYTHPEPLSERYLKTMDLTLGIPYQGEPERQVDMQFYFGPNKYSTMRKYQLDLEKQIPLGWSFFLLQWINRFAVIPVFNWLGSFGWNYGIIILVLTIMLKVVLFPVAYKMYKSTAKMRVLKPEVDEISKKFPKKEDAMKKQKATMDLYKKAGVNPMAGCVPMLLQLPILIALFRFFPSSIELRQQPFLWATDLSSYDSILKLPFDIPFYGDHVSLFTLLMTVSTIIYTRVNNQMMGASSSQMPGMKTMMYIMPVMFLGIFNNYASALSYYYLLANLITFGQMFIIRKTINEKKIYLKIQEKKKKPKTKSGFQKRLEEAAKKKGYDPRRR